MYSSHFELPNTKIKKKAPEPPKPAQKSTNASPKPPIKSNDDDAPDIPDPEEIKARKTQIKASQDVRRPTKGTTNPLENFSREDILRKGKKIFDVFFNAPFSQISIRNFEFQRNRIRK